ncbi:MAG: ATP-binding cassette domain-containing protein, partial [Leptospiraceae bacterium]|nr:ATP-binding cassette domain-containing protein [Leptospiraceae bacterium]
MSNSSAEVVIAANSLSRSYKDVQALKSLNIEVRRGEIFGFLGPNGAGKTTFVKLMLDFIAPSSGEIEILGDSPARLNRARIGYLPERVSIHPFLTGRELMIYRGHLLGLE